ncbi:YbaK/aminoacyl-tRNA synthetase-associated domain-containing protein [Mycotypha africana]|uniref:YbaK/aminoacyl-tRNA synthetase-associated domain-containing protein n=1 Tax=Mycotypha africana TaxID=64632 RepID=UPI002301F752|nr:YbaK/aminoacyl-tRNA synthetase-associated domain-containing protein [Mycotypha africana]KAI8981621.1 YbaK/aminoacyl-tRNA synthetase-associated domain-containing protein [Mycotypha africana]
MLTVKDLSLNERDKLRKLQNDISLLYSSVSDQYMENWKDECQRVTYTDCPETVSKVQKAIADLGISDCQIIPVESDYYDWELQQRAFRVNMPSKEHMCKSVIMENTRCMHEDFSDPNYSKYYCVITQYVKPVNTQKLLNFCRGLKNKEISKKYYNYRLAPPEMALELTGFEKGGVAPLGMKHSIPIIMAESITKLKPPVICLGAGHIDWKLSIPISTLIEKTNCFVADLE